MGIWRVLRGKDGGKGGLLMIDSLRQLNVITASSITQLVAYLCTCREKPSKDTTEGALRSKLTEVSGRIAQAMEAERAGRSREVDLLPTKDEKFNDLDLDFPGFNSDSETQGSVMLEEDVPRITLE